MTLTTINLTIGGTTARSNKGQHPVSIAWDKLPEESRDFIVKYGLKQYLADGMARAEDEAQAKALVDERVAKLLAADFSRASGESKPDSIEARALRMAKEFVRAKLKEANATADKEKVAAAAEKLVEAQPKWKAEAKKQIEAERKAKEALAEAGDEAADAIFGDLLASVADTEE